MELFIFLVIAVVVVAVFFRWILISLVVIITMISGGFFAGLGAGVFTYFLLEMSKWIALGYLAGRATTVIVNQPDTKEQTCTTHKSKS